MGVRSLLMLEATVISASADNTTLKPKIKAEMVRGSSRIHEAHLDFRALAEISVEVGAIV
jgi:hypothetical protein